MNGIESTLYEISKFLLMPVLLLLCLMFVYALFCLGMLLYEMASRQVGRSGSRPISTHVAMHPLATQEALELFVLKQIEMQRLTSRIAPMLGLVATMIPMGPALIAVSSGNAKGMAENLVVAFSAVIVALLAAAMTYLVHTVRKRWLLEELIQILDGRESGGSLLTQCPAATSANAGGAAHAR